MSESEKSSPETKGHQPPAERLEEGHPPPTVETTREYGHQPPETRGHQPPAGKIELGHPPAEGVVIVQQVGEMHQPAHQAPAPTAAPPKPADSAQSVTPPPQAESLPPPPAPDQGE